MHGDTKVGNGSGGDGVSGRLEDEFPEWEIVPPVMGKWFAFRQMPPTPAQRACDGRSVVTARTLRGLRDELLTEAQRDEQASHVHLV